MSQTKCCPECGAELPAGAPQGLCPRCLLGAGLESRGEASPPPDDPAQAPTTPHPAGFAPPTPETLAAHFPQLEILELVGHGGMGAVYKARQPRLDRVVALKIIRPEAADDSAFAERFNREARTLARLSHPHIVGVYDFGEAAITAAAEQGPPRRLYYFLMEYVEGASLRQVMQAGELTPQQALTIVPQVCEALQFAHDEGVVHRDIKPENILLDKRGRVKIADFGLAKLMGCAPENYTLTGTHQVMGTPRYMAPEQMEGSHAVDHRADIYSLGVVFYEMLTGEVPAGHFEPPSRKVEIDLRLDEVVLRALAREPERRYQQASEVKSEVESVSKSEKPLRRMADAASRPRTTGRDWVTLTREQIDNDRLPDCCIVCGRHTVERINRDFHYQPDWAVVLTFIGFFFFFFPALIIASLTTHTIRMACPICPIHRNNDARRRLSWTSAGWLAAPVLGLIGFGVAYPFVDLTASVAFAALGAVIGILVYLVPVLWLARPTFDVEWITNDYVRFRGVSAEFASEAGEMSGAPQSDPPRTDQHRPFPSTIRTAWDDWRAERDRWLTGAMSASLAVVALACLLAFFYPHISLRWHPSRHARVELGPSFSPWFRSETGQGWRPLPSWSWLLVPLAFLAWYIRWEIVKTQARAENRPVRWRDSLWFLIAWTIGAYFLVAEAAVMLPHLPLNVAWDAALVVLVAVVLLLPWAFIFLPQRSKDLSGPPAASVPVSKQ